jgi:hypothetical protein
MKPITIPTDLKHRLITNLGVTSDDLDDAVRETQESTGVTPFVAYVDQGSMLRNYI